ncbi:DMT family transporter [Brevibacillus sp. NRS-1366]|uniref:DMT family transporter n=1 Tax=Brevibacillus sp. NRS-1366 TaxID=3233899 RepID=UPI003D255257
MNTRGELSRIKMFSLISFLVLVWGLSWPIYKIALSYTPPILFAGLRTILGGLGMLILLLPRCRRIRFKENWPVYLISSFFNIILFFGLQTMGLTYLPSGLFSVIVYLQPILVGIFAWLWLRESISVIKIVGLILGFLGVAIVSVEGMSGQISVIGISFALSTAISWAIGTVYLKKVERKVDLLWSVAMQCIIGGTILICLGLVIEDWTAIVWNSTYVSCLLYGAIIGVPAGSIAYFKLISLGEASRAAVYTFIVPLISVAVGVAFLHESFSTYLVAGLFLIMLAIYLVNRKQTNLSSLEDE